MSTYVAGKDEIREANAWGTLLFVSNYTESVIDRWVWSCYLAAYLRIA